MLHVSDIDVDADNIIQCAAGFLDCGLHVLADLPGLHLDIAESGDVPSAMRAVMPEMKTRVPFAAIAVACEKCPFGCRSFFETICFFITLLS